jgi:hypothetical protein
MVDDTTVRSLRAAFSVPSRRFIPGIPIGILHGRGAAGA